MFPSDTASRVGTLFAAVIAASFKPASFRPQCALPSPSVADVLQLLDCARRPVRVT